MYILRSPLRDIVVGKIRGEWKKIQGGRKKYFSNVLRSLAKLLRSLAKLLRSLEKLCVLSQNFCVPSRNFAFSRKTFAFSRKDICVPSQNLKKKKYLRENAKVLRENAKFLEGTQNIWKIFFPPTLNFFHSLWFFPTTMSFKGLRNILSVMYILFKYMMHKYFKSTTNSIIIIFFALRFGENSIIVVKISQF